MSEMGEMKNEIIWEWCQYRVLRRADIGPDAALLIETRTHDALGGESWRETPDGEAGMVIERLAVELHDRVKKAEAGRERFREVVEAKLPEHGLEKTFDDGIRFAHEADRSQLACALGLERTGMSWDQLIEAVGKVREEAARGGRFDASASRCALLDGHAGLHRSGDELHEGAPSRPAPVGKAPGQVERSIKLEIALDPGSNTSPDDLRRIFVDAFDQAQTNLRAPKVPGFYTPIPGVEMAALRAELAALGKHVEDVERRAYDTPTKAAFGDCLNKTLEVEQRIRLGEEMAKRIDQKLDTRANAISIDYYAMRARIDALEENRPSPKPDNLGMTYAERLALASAGKAETLEAVRSLTDALQALEAQTRIDAAVLQGLVRHEIDLRRNIPRG